MGPQGVADANGGLKRRKPKRCRHCKFFHLGGMGAWCTHAGRAAHKATGECLLKDWRDKKVSYSADG